ncbi:tetraspanin-15-like isoform X3 [Tympanuchus pallidicinctus]|uniref:tetraspanin-15-like isoform X3 n=1 Tax=Tympanuchus pallidicinctus TaxID=109042 RepID=UPI0022873284|nr:tetraspanin-15-like isoform X3 [Tympanuchus pallidicinctus]
MAQGSECRNSLLYYYSVKFALSTYATLFSFFWVLLVIFITELLLIFIEIIFENKMNAVLHSNIQEGIRHYYDDLDFKNILDFVQEKFSCCGGDEYRDWEVNLYHSCNGSGPLACGVPYTCCVRKVPGEVINTLCGYRTLEKERLELLDVIHVRGCIHAVGLWLKDNFESTLSIVCSLLLPQVVGLVMAWLYWQKLNEIYSQLDTVDFRMLEVRDFSFGALDLSGAGWCWCLPKEGGYIPINAMEEEEEEEEEEGLSVTVKMSLALAACWLSCWGGKKHHQCTLGYP